VVIWPDSDLFTEQERAALHFADQVTLLAETRVPEESVHGVVTAFGEKGAAALLSLLVAAHAWNTIGVTTRCWSTSLKADA
jgi:alkylhydroperoxidase family enzyme